MKERRMFQRYRVNLPVEFVNLKDSSTGAGTMIDISPGGGGMIITKERLEPETPLDMKLIIPETEHVLSASGDVVWSAMVGPNTCRVGIRFEKIDFLSLARLLGLNYY